MNHYPDGDVYDHETHGQYYYHAHRDDEHGHFHLFLRPKGMPSGIKPAAVEDFEEPKAQNDALSHLIAISMDEFGRPKALFTTNRWVTAEYWYGCEDVIRMLDHLRSTMPIRLGRQTVGLGRWFNCFIHKFAISCACAIMSLPIGKNNIQTKMFLNVVIWM